MFSYIYMTLAERCKIYFMAQNYRSIANGIVRFYISLHNFVLFANLLSPSDYNTARLRVIRACQKPGFFEKPGFYSGLSEPYCE
jgi:hypothetical protein